MLKNIPEKIKNIYDFAYFPNVRLNNSICYFYDSNFDKINFKKLDAFTSPSSDFYKFDGLDTFKHYILKKTLLLIIYQRKHKYENIFEVSYDKDGKEEACSICIGKTKSGQAIYANFYRNKKNILAKEPWVFHSLSTSEDKTEFFKKNNFKQFPQENVYEKCILSNLSGKYVPDEIDNTSIDSAKNHIICDHLNTKNPDYYNQGKRYFERFPKFVKRDDYEVMDNFMDQLYVENYDKSQTFKFYGFRKDKDNNITGLMTSYAYPLDLNYQDIRIPMALIFGPDGYVHTIFNYQMLMEKNIYFSRANPNINWIKNTYKEGKFLYKLNDELFQNLKDENSKQNEEKSKSRNDEGR